MAKPFVRKFSSGDYWVLKIKLLSNKWHNFNSEIPVRYDATGEPTVKSRRDAERAQREIQEAELRGDKPFDEKVGADVGALQSVIESYIESRVSRWSANTTVNRRVNTSDALKFFGNVQVSSLVTARIAEYADYLASKHAPSTVNSKLTDLYAVLNHARKRLKVSGVEYEREFLDEPEEVGDYLDVDELSAVLEVAATITLNGESIRDFIAFAAYTGMRRGEILQAKRSWIRGEEMLVPGFEKVGGRMVRVTKNGKGRRIPLWSGLKEVVARCPKQGLLFPKMTVEVGRRFKSAVHLAGVTRDVHLHCLRDTFVHLASQAGVPIEVVRAVVGNDLKVLLRHYAGVRSSDMLKAMERSFGSTLVRASGKP